MVLPVPEKPLGIVSKSPDELVEVGMDELLVEEDVEDVEDVDDVEDVEDAEDVEDEEDEEDDEVDEVVSSSGKH